MSRPSPPANAIRHTHRVIPNEIRIFPDLDCQAQIVCTFSLMLLPELDSGLPTPLRDAISPDIELIAGPLPGS
jgi:hypothetical protein